MPKTKPRPSELMIAIDRMLLALYAIERARPPYSEHAFGTAIELLFVMMKILVGTADDQPPTGTEISHDLKMPRTSVMRRIDQLVAAGMIRRYIGTSYVADLDKLDALATGEWFAEVEGVVSETAETLAGLKEARPLRRRWQVVP